MRITKRAGIAAAVLGLVMGAGGLAAAPAQAAGRNAGINNIHTCGHLTCSDYYSHNATVQFDQILQGADMTTAQNAGWGCGLVAGAVATRLAVAGELMGIPCAMLESVAQVVGNVEGIIHHAATSNGCMRFQHPRGSDDVVIAVYADHSSTCHSMDT